MRFGPCRSSGGADCPNSVLMLGVPPVSGSPNAQLPGGLLLPCDVHMQQCLPYHAQSVLYTAQSAVMQYTLHSVH